MSNESITSLILFIGAVAVAGSIAGTLGGTVQGMSSSIDDVGSSVTTAVETDITIISDAGSPNSIYNNTTGNVTLLIKNTGSTQLNENGLDILIDGQYIEPTNVTTTVVGTSGSEWRANTVLEVEIDHSLGSGEHRAKVSINGVRETIEFFL